MSYFGVKFFGLLPYILIYIGTYIYIHTHIYMYYMCSVRKKLSSFPGKLELERKSTGERVKSEDFLDCSE